MNAPDSFNLRLSAHLLSWELFRLRWPLLVWLAVAPLAAWLTNIADWEFPRDPLAREAHLAARVRVESGLHLLIAAVVYFAGELFLPLQPGVVRGRFAWPVRRGDALLVALLIGAVLILLPLLFYFRGWLMARGWDQVDAVYYRQYLPLPLCFAGLMLAALTAGDWGVYLLTAALTLMAVLWSETSQIIEPLKTGPALLCTTAALAIAFVTQQWPRRWVLYCAWAGLCVLVLR